MGQSSRLSGRLGNGIEIAAFASPISQNSTDVIAR
jgi:hypothetical protein